MSSHKSIDKICCVIIAATLALTLFFVNGKAFGLTESPKIMGYETRIFDTSRVHDIQIIMDDWNSFLETCTNEEYSPCTVIIDDEAYKNIAIRAKGNTSLTQVSSYGNDRYSFKIEFDHYDNSQTYHGLDKLCLNNLIQDNTCLKDYITYQMMQKAGAVAPLCSFVYITVNGEDWGLYLAIESVEESFLQRNYGSDYGNVYKPDSQTMGGGRGNGKDFRMEDLEDMNPFSGGGTQPEELPENSGESGESGESIDGNTNNIPDSVPGDNGNPPDNTGILPVAAPGDLSNLPENAGGAPASNSGRAFHGGFGREQGGMSMGSNDVKLVYTDDNYESYSSIFENAKTDITDQDKDRLIASIKSLNANENIENVVDIDSVIRYFAVHNFVLNFDSYTGSMIHNYYLYEKDGQMAMIPWDYNLAFGGFMGASDAASLVNYPIDSPVSGGTTDSRPMLNWIFENEEYTQLYHEYLRDFITEYFDSGDFSEDIDAVTSMIAPYVEKDPTKFCTYEEFLSGASALKKFCLLRAQSVSGQLNGDIASLAEEQDSSTFIDTGDLNMSDMGSMNNGRDGGFADRGLFRNQFANNKPEENNSGDNGPADSLSGENPLTDNKLTDNNSGNNQSANNKSIDSQSSNNPSTDNQVGSNESGNNRSADNDSSDNELTDNNSGENQPAAQEFAGRETVSATDIPEQPESINNNQMRPAPSVPDQVPAEENIPWGSLGISLAVLLCGLLFAGFYHGRH